MKKQLLFLGFLFCVTLSFSQIGMYGVRAGINVSNMDFDPDATFSNQHRNGFAIGFFGEYLLGDAIALTPEIQFSAEGAKSRDLRIDYIQAPILFKFFLADRFAISAGPMVGLKVHEYEDGFKNIAFSAAGGLEFKVTEMFFIDARYHYGILNVLDDNLPMEAKNASFQFGVGIKI